VKHQRIARTSTLTIALIPSTALAVIGLSLSGVLVHQGLQAREFAERAVVATVSATRLVADVQEERRRIDIGHPQVGPSHDKLVDDALARLQRDAANAPDARVGYQQVVAAQLLAVVDGLSRTDALAAAGIGFTAAQWRSFNTSFGWYHVNLAAVVLKLPARGQELYADLVRGEQWRRLSAIEDAFVDGERSPAAQADWRASARQVADELAALSAQQTDYATQLAECSGNRTMAGALAGGAAIVILSVLAFCLAIRLSRRLDAENITAANINAANEDTPLTALRSRHRAGPLARALNAVD
jgi:hypothetical protein